MQHPKKTPPKPVTPNLMIDPKVAKSFIDQKQKEEDERSFQQISLKISKDLLARCDYASQLASVTRSSFIKMAILEKLERQGR